MSALIKSGDLLDISVVRPLAAMNEKPRVSEIEEERRRLLMRIAGLESEVRERETAIGKLEVEVELAHQKGHEEGRELGRREATDQQSERLLLLENSMRRAQEQLSSGLKSLERLSALLASDCLDMIFGNPDYRSEQVAQIIGAQMRRIEKAMLVDIKLSRDDFPDDQALIALSGRLGLSDMPVGTGADMASGGCVMTLRLGSMDVGVGRQWGVLREALAQIASLEGNA